MQNLINNIKELVSQILSADETAFSDAMIKELAGINLNEKLIKLSYTISIKDYSPEKKEFIIKNLGEEVNADLELLHRIASISLPEKDRQMQSLRKIFIELSGDLMLIIFKLYERLVSLKMAFQNQTLEIKQLSEECLNLYAPIAHRLGIRQIYNGMEDIAFKVIYPESSAKLEREIEKNRPLYNQKLAGMATLLKQQMTGHGINCDIQYRVKRPYSIYKKLVNQNIEINSVYDLLAVRVITDKVENCYLALGIVHKNYIPIEKRFKDWVTYPKPNGYRSIQTTVFTNTGEKFEIQIRTHEMHREAEYGSAAHWAYKEKVNTNADWISRLKEFLENDEYFNNPDALEELLKSESKKSYIHILTPKGDVKTIPEGSTILDFAGTIHTDVLYTCIGGRVNGKFVKLKTELKTGDVVEILTNKNSTPSRDWLAFLKSPSARSKVILWLKKNESGQLSAEGKRAWERFKKQNRHKIAQYDDEAVFKENISKVGYKNTDDFYAAIGTNSLKLSVTLLRKLYPKAFEKKKEVSGKDKSSRNLDKVKVRVEGLDNIDTTIAKCCSPIKGQNIIAYVTMKTGIKIHLQDCPYIVKSKDNSRIKTAEWVDTDNLQSTKIKVFGNDYSQLLSAIVETSTALKTSIINIEKRSSGSTLECAEVTLQIKNIDELNAFVVKLKNNSYVTSIS